MIAAGQLIQARKSHYSQRNLPSPSPLPRGRGEGEGAI